MAHAGSPETGLKVEPQGHAAAFATMTDAPSDPARQGPLNPHAEPGTVIIENPPAAALHMTADEADISGIRLLDAADHARRRRERPDD